jgi:hypothetical protein
MKNALKQEAPKPMDKGKGKSSSLPPKVVTGAIASNTKGKGRTEPEMKKPSLKDRMKRKEKPKPEAPSKFVPMVFDDDEELEGENEPEPQVMTPPMSAPKETFPPPPTEEIAPQGHPDTMLPELEGPPVASPPQLQASNPETVVPQPQAPSQIPTTIPLSGSEPEHTDLTALEQVSAPEEQPPIENQPNLEEKEAMSIPPVVDSVHPDDQVGSATSTVVDPVAEPQVEVVDGLLPTEEPAVQPICQPEAQPQPQEALPAQSMQPAKPKPIPKKRSQSNIPTSTRITRSAFKPPAPVLPKTTRSKLFLIDHAFICL